MSVTCLEQLRAAIELPVANSPGLLVTSLGPLSRLPAGRFRNRKPPLIVAMLRPPMPPPPPSWDRRRFIKLGLASCATAGLTLHRLPGTESPRTNVSPGSIAPEQDWIVVTEAPYFADPSGTRDSTAALQRALNDSRDRTTVCFFPSGTYLISDTLSCEQRVEKLAEPRYTDDMRQSWWDIRSDRFYILGSTQGPRPVLKLSADAHGFDDPANPKLGMRIWAQTRNDVPGTHDPEWGSEQPNILFGQVFRGVDFDISGHPGAIALRFAGSQGCSLMDCRVNARGAFAGFNDCPGQGGGSYNLEVVGGRHAVWADSYYRFPMLAACSFLDQEDAAIVYADASLPFVLVGCHLRSQGNALVDLTRLNAFPGISFIDSIIELPPGGALVRAHRQLNIMLENVWTRGLARFSDHTSERIASSEWLHIEGYANCSDDSRNLINGKTSQDVFFVSRPAEQPPSADELRRMHWPDLPSFEEPAVVNLRDFGAVGDGITDDSDALVAALGQSVTVFVPAGTYRITKSVTLPPRTRLFGYRGALFEGTAIRTTDTPDDPTLIAFLNFGAGITWSCGKGVWAFAAGDIESTENGGGRFYINRFHSSRPDGQLFADTRQAITLYTLNIERRTVNPQAYVRNVRGLRIFYLKAEASPVGYGVHGGPNTGNTPLAIIDSTGVRVYGASGNVLTVEDRPFIEVKGSRDVKLCHVKSFHARTFPQVLERFHGTESSVSSQNTVALFVRD